MWGRLIDDASTLAAAVPGAGDLTEDRLHRLDAWLGGVYPPDVAQRWGSLQPDRLGEYLIATTLPDLPGLLSALLTATDAGRVHRALNILARALGNPSLTSTVATQLLTQVRGALAADLGRLGPVALQVITETAYPQRMLAALQDAAETADEAVLEQLVLEQLVKALPEFSESLADLAAPWTARRVAHLRTHAGASDPDTLTPSLAKALQDHSDRLSFLDHHEEALAASTEAVTIYRELATGCPDTFTRGLASALTDQSERLAALGRFEEALAVSTEAVTMYRELAAADADAATPTSLRRWRATRRG